MGFRLAEAFVAIEAEDNTDKGVKRTESHLKGWASRLGLGKDISDGIVDNLDIDSGVAKLTVQLERGANRAGKEAGDSASDGFNDGFGKKLMGGLSGMLKGALSKSVLPVVAGVGANAGLQLAGALAPAIGAVGVLPGALLATKAATGVLKVAVMGLGEAIGAGFEGDAAKFEEAIKDFHPAMQSVAREVVGLKPQIEGLRQSVQGAFFGPLVGDVKSLAGTYLPMLKTNMTGIAGDFGAAAGEVSTFLQSKDGFATVNVLAGNLRQTIGNVVEGLPGLAKGFLTFTQVGSNFLPGLTSGFGDLTDKFANFMEQASASGQLHEFISGGLSVLGELGGLLVDVGSIFMSVFQAANAGGGDLLGTIGQLVGQFAAFLNSAQGMAMLESIFTVLGQVSSIFGQALAAVLPVIGNLVTVLASALQPILPIISDAIAGLAPIVAQLGTTLGAVLVPVIGAVTSILQALLPAILPIIQSLANALMPVVVSLAPVIGALGTVIATILGSALTALQPLFDALVPVLLELSSTLFPALIPLVEMVGELFLALMPAITPIVKLLAQNLIQTIKILNPLINVLIGVIKWLMGGIIDIVGPIASFIGWLAKAIAAVTNFTNIKTTFSNLWKGIKEGAISGISSFLTKVKELPKKIVSAVGNLGQLLVNKGKDIVHGLWSGIQSMGGWIYDKIIGWARNMIPGPIAKALGIASPSKVAAKLAEEVPRGVVVGMKRGDNMVRHAAENLARAALPKMPNVSAMPVRGGTAPIPSTDTTSSRPVNLTVNFNVGSMDMASPADRRRAVEMIREELVKLERETR